jgi:hypothetical protein
MTNSSSKLSDPKIIAVAALIIGLILGFYVDSTILSKPRIDELTQTVTQQQQTLTTLENQLSVLQEEHVTLQEQYDQLEESSISLSEYNQLQQQYDEQETQLEYLQGSAENLETIVNTLTDENQNLENELESLQEKYYHAYNPLYVAFIINNLKLNLTINTDVYPQNSAISGTVSITHTNGSPFNGDFRLSLTKVYQNLGTSSEIIEIQGLKEYTWNNPFVMSAGSYKLSFLEVRDSQENVILNSNQLKSFVIYLFQG